MEGVGRRGEEKEKNILKREEKEDKSIEMVKYSSD